MRTSRRLVAVVASLTLSASAALADPVNAGQWYEFRFDGPGSFATTCVGFGCVPSSGGNSVFAPDAPWTHASLVPITFTVTDAFLRINSFTVFNFAAVVGSTPAPTNVGSCGSDPAVCVVDPLTSHASFALPAGAYSFTIRNDAGTAGAAYFRIDATVTAAPEPATVVLVGGGLLALAAAARRRARA